jgi:anaerobic selenocysteine-containing dehydrogenase
VADLTRHLSSLMGELGCDPLPTPAQPGPEPDGTYPLLLITGNGFDPMYNSEQRQWPSARRSCPDPLVTLHPETAGRLGLGEGDWVRIETRQGTIRQRLSLSTAIHSCMADSQHGWWFPEEAQDPDQPFGYLRANVNALVRDEPAHCSEGTGGWLQTGLPCRIVVDG